MKLIDTILLSLSVAFLIIGVHQLIVITNNQSFADGLMQSYWLFMLTLVLFLYYRIRRNRQDEGEKMHSGKTAHSDKRVPIPKSAPKSRKTR